jgi:hypothetical protein
MYLQDYTIQIRDWLINQILDLPAEAILNPKVSPEHTTNSVEIAAQVKRAVNAFKAAAVDPQGYQVNYQQIASSQAYQDFRNSCTPKLRGLNLDVLNTRQKKLSFWINLYNALVIDAVISFEIKKSLTENRLGVLVFFRRAAYQIAGQRFSLGDIEHGILRANRGHPYLPGPQFTSSDIRNKWVVSEMDQRVHFALNCASRSCPPIGVYTADRLNEQLNLATRNFMDTNINVEPAGNKLSLSSIFRWYKSDFGGREEVLSFLLDYLPSDSRSAWLKTHQKSVTFKYQPYDWGLNLAR